MVHSEAVALRDVRDDVVRCTSMGAKLNWAVLPIFSGPLKGDRWLLSTRSSFFFGTYEPAQTALFCKVVKPGDVVYDVGAHFGYYTLLASKLVGPEGRVLAFEPSPPNLARLYRHIELNRYSNVQVLELAIGDREGIVRFEARAGSGLGHLAADGPTEVKVTRLDALQGHPLPKVIKIDVEGAEVGVLQGAASLLAAAKPSIFLSLHGDDLKRTCLEILAGYGYAFQDIGPLEIFALSPRVCS